jgi:hypothetical protein
MTRSSLIVCGFLLLPAVALQADIDVERMVDVLAMKETGTRWDGKVGPTGELSAWQITEPVWREHMAPRPFEEARDPALARTCAAKHVRWLVTQVERRGQAATPERVATCWHFGPGHARQPSRWGADVANLYQDRP